MTIPSHRHLVRLLPLLLLSGCVARNAPEERTLSTGDCLPVAESFVSGLRRNDVAYLDDMVDWEGMAERVESREKMNAFERRQRALVLRSRFGIGERLVARIRNGGSGSLLHLHTVDGEPRGLIRLIAPDGAFEYYDMVFGFGRESGEIVVKDLYLYSCGKPYSRVVEWLRGIDGEGEVPVPEGSDESEEERMARRKQLDSLVRFVHAKQLDRFIPLYRSLPESYRRERFLLAFYLDVARSGGLDAYGAAVDLYAGYHPDDPSTSYHRIDRYMAAKEYAGAIAAIMRLDSIVDDPYLKHLRGICHLGIGDTVTAERMLRVANRAEPVLLHPYRPLIDLHARGGNHKEAVRYIEQYARVTRMPAARIESELAGRGGDAYEALLASTEYERWKRHELRQERADSIDK